jgi:hypothetical protein
VSSNDTCGFAGAGKHGNKCAIFWSTTSGEGCRCCYRAPLPKGLKRRIALISHPLSRETARRLCNA